MNAAAERRREDVRRLQETAGHSGGRVRVIRTSGDPISSIVLELQFRTAGGRNYPSRTLDRVTATIELPSRYPWERPTLTLDPPVFHPNVYPSGRVCLGTRWLPTEGLDLLLRRVLQIVTFDPSLLNDRSPANNQALAWYRATRRANPAAFPSDSLELARHADPPRLSMTWNNIHLQAPVPQETPTPVAEPQRVVACPRCRQGLRVPTGRVLDVRCTCGHRFRVNT